MSSDLERLKQVIGEFYVDLTHRLTGGEITENGANDSNIGNPDIVNWKKNQGYESKGSFHSDRFIIRDAQVEHYKKFEKQIFPLDSPEVYYFLWRHRVKPVEGLKEEELLNALRINTDSLLVLSFDIIKSGSVKWARVNPQVWAPHAALKVSTTKGFFSNASSELSLLGLNPEDYAVRDKTVCNLRYQKRKVCQFRVREIFNKELKGLPF